MIWIDAGTHTLSSGSDGSLLSYFLAMQDWGLQVTKVVDAIEIINRSSDKAQIGAKHVQGPTPDRDIAKEHSTVVTLTTANMDLPAFLQGAAVGTTTALLPYFWPKIEVDADGVATQQWVTFRLWLGGSPF